MSFQDLVQPCAHSPQPPSSVTFRALERGSCGTIRPVSIQDTASLSAATIGDQLTGRVAK
ncbi:hypothetical protein [Streptomyces sp. NRRL S-813]|uniref:hypothetical protein n=1 Tax=Streptomyces sp. NRRL S-813 TaxID=1463919 RepID=UPI0004C25516|nr:hypothetical protein [Streptomyces sp. NRRL S-813]